MNRCMSRCLSGCSRRCMNRCLIRLMSRSCVVQQGKKPEHEGSLFVRRCVSHIESLLCCNKGRSQACTLGHHLFVAVSHMESLLCGATRGEARKNTRYHHLSVAACHTSGRTFCLPSSLSSLFSLFLFSPPTPPHPTHFLSPFRVALSVSGIRVSPRKRLVQP